jgi:hypothetical protein
MTADQERQLETAILSGDPLEEIVELLRRYKAQGVGRDEVYSFLEALRGRGLDEADEDRVLEVADFVAGFCSPHMRIWGS